jgi:hypothetical protein
MNDDMLSPQPLSIEPPRRDRITAISDAIQRRPIVLVLGMHRSGTSLCSHLLSALGLDMTDNIAAPGSASVTPDNPRGHWERWEIIEFHDRILALFNRGYFGHFHDFALPVAWWADPRVAQIRREIVAFLEKRMGEGYFGFKDPRTVRLMPMWHQIFNELKLAPRLVLCLRNPAEIGRSLNARDGLDPEIGEYRWLVHMIDFFRYTSKYDICMVEYEGWFTDPAANIEKLRKFLDLPWLQSESDLSLVLSGIIDRAARHDDSNHREASQPLVRTLYKLASSDGQDGARDQIAYIVSQFVSFQQLQKPLLQAFEDVARTAAKYPETEQEVTRLRAVVSERDAVVEAAGVRAAAVEGRLAEALAETEAQRAQIADLARERDELGIALQAAQAELATHEAALRRAEQETQEHGTAALAMQSEIAASRIALAQAERAEQERTASVAALEAELSALREMLAHTEQEVQRRAASEAALQSEIARLHGTLAKAEHETQGRAATVATLQAEICALQETLTAARQVGKAAIAAFRIETATPIAAVAERGLSLAIMRFFGSRASV